MDLFFYYCTNIAIFIFPLNRIFSIGCIFFGKYFSYCLYFTGRDNNFCQKGCARRFQVFNLGGFIPYQIFITHYSVQKRHMYPVNRAIYMTAV